MLLVAKLLLLASILVLIVVGSLVYWESQISVD